MVEELQEADVLWPETTFSAEFATTVHQSRRKTSPAADVPQMLEDDGNDRLCSPGCRRNDDEYKDESGGAGKKVITPPHIVIARRMIGKMEFSVCTGAGRTLKGRDLYYLRNLVLRLTGYIER